MCLFPQQTMPGGRDPGGSYVSVRMHVPRAPWARHRSSPSAAVLDLSACSTEGEVVG